MLKIRTVMAEHRNELSECLGELSVCVKADFICHPERSEAESNFFRLRSQTSLRSVCSSLRSEFDYAQDDVDEKSAEQSKAGSTKNQRTYIAEPKPSGAMYISQRAIKKSFWFRFFQKSAEPTANLRTHIARPMPSGTLYISQRSIKESFCGAFFKKRQRKTALFFLRSFFFCASCVKRKSDTKKLVSVRVQRTMCVTSL